MDRDSQCTGAWVLVTHARTSPGDTPASDLVQIVRAHLPASLQDEAIEIEGPTFYGSPWQPAFHSWAFNVPCGHALAAKWAAIPEHTDVLVTHAPPMGIGDRVHEQERAGCADLLHRVLTIQPTLHLFGHIHTDGGRWDLGATTFANVTTDEGMRPVTVFDLDG